MLGKRLPLDFKVPAPPFDLELIVNDGDNAPRRRSALIGFDDNGLSDADSQLLERVNRLLRGGDLCADDEGSGPDEETADRDLRACGRSSSGPAHNGRTHVAVRASLALPVRSTNTWTLPYEALSPLCGRNSGHRGRVYVLLSIACGHAGTLSSDR